jgi:hypothetical protein
MTSRVRGLRGRLADDGQPSSSAPRRLGVGIRQLRIGIHELTSYHQMGGNDLCEILRQPS